MCAETYIYIDRHNSQKVIDKVIFPFNKRGFNNEIKLSLFNSYINT